MAELNWKQHKSSLIKASAYNPVSEILIVEFYNGSQHKYFNVTQDMYDNFTGADSIGKHFHLHIKGLKSEAVKK